MDYKALWEEYEAFKARGLKLDMSRGKPSPEQLDLSLDALTIADYIDDTGVDARNYGNLEGLPEARRFFAELQDVELDECIVCGNSSLELMFHLVTLSARQNAQLPVRKWLCPVPGYDRHFNVTEKLGFEMLNVAMTESGPDMDEVERLAADPAVCGIWCVPTYSNPDGYVYSDATVQRLAALTAANPNFTIIWDDAYKVHHLTETAFTVANMLKACKAAGNPDRAVMLCSTSKITFAGAGVAALAASSANVKRILAYLADMIITFDKLNQLRTVRFLKSQGGLEAHMRKHASIVRPKFDAVAEIFEQEFRECPGIAYWSSPAGGYFISLYTQRGRAKRTVQLCKDAGVTLTAAGAAFPYGIDAQDYHIRVAPTYPSVEELREAAHLLALCVKLSSQP
ncbi:MAG: aminotransferase class I/II-fold pyridoxal phosphate-dependent enzyme [Oscillospiraceae bacterium]|jgi:DNA-binding transcriptional MocR family regulator|nr:aminotransferase class I/II-fold pyridoxal phosphate-dependent enzyme [Oscillospiraceae bacterium]